jgi:hypothetical protein
MESLGKEILYKLVPVCEGYRNHDGSYTTSEIFGKGPGMSNQVEVEEVEVNKTKIKVVKLVRR